MAPRRADSQPATTTSSDNVTFAKQLAIEVLLTAVSAALSYVVLQAVARHVPGLPSTKPQDPKRTAAAARKRLNNAAQDIKFDEYEDIIAGDMIFPEEIDVTFADIGGHEQDKKEIFDLIALPLKHPDVFTKLSSSELLSPPKGILLYGPPGTGKTMMAKAIAKESGAAFINLKMSTTMNLYFGESQKLVRATFSLARKLAPCIIFIDEIDSFLHERRSDDNSALGNMKAEFMSLWDGMEGDSAHRYGVVVIGATNRPWDVDAAILRRMPRTFEMGLPDVAEREKVLRLVLRSEKLDADLEARLPELAQACAGYSGSDLKEMCRAAVTIPYREFASGFRTNQSRENENGEGENNPTIRPLTWKDFAIARKNVRPSGESAGEYMQKAHGTSSGRQSASPGFPAMEFASSSDESFIAGVQYGLSLARQQQQQQQQQNVPVDPLD